MDKQKQIEEMRFKVIDNNTGKEADICEIALKEDWAKDLIYCDMQGFAILDDGNLVLLDECGKYVYCPNGRFSAVPEDAVVIEKSEYDKLRLLADECIDWRRKNCNINEICKEITDKVVQNGN